MEKRFEKDGKLHLRFSNRGMTLYSSLTIRDPQLINQIRKLSVERNVTPARILGKFVEDAFEAGVALKI